MELFAAVDLLGGRSVRLLRGDFAQVSDYGDPLATALELQAGGAQWLHLVDLEAARTGQRMEEPLVSRIVAAVEIPVQLGGGIRHQSEAAALLDSGVSRVVLGTAALQSPELVRTLSAAWPGRVAVGLDHRGAPEFALATAGWTGSAAIDLGDAARLFEEAGASALVITSIPTDGTLQGPDLEGLAAALAATQSIDVVASGGVGELGDLHRLGELRAGERRVAGVVVGRALRDGRMSVAEAVQACAAFG